MQRYCHVFVCGCRFKRLQTIGGLSCVCQFLFFHRRPFPNTNYYICYVLFVFLFQILTHSFIRWPRSWVIQIQCFVFFNNFTLHKGVAKENSNLVVIWLLIVGGDGEEKIKYSLGWVFFKFHLQNKNYN